MPVQGTIGGGKKLVGSTTKIRYSSGVVKDEFNSEILEVGRYEDRPVVKISNTLGIEDSYYKDVETVEATEEYFIYPLSKESFDKLTDVKGLESEGFNS